MKYADLIKLIDKFASLSEFNDLNLHKLYKMVLEGYEIGAQDGIWGVHGEPYYKHIVKSIFPDVESHMDIFKKATPYFMDKELKKSNPNIMFLVDFFLLSDRSGQVKYIRLMPDEALPALNEVLPYYHWQSDVLLYFYKRLADYYEGIGKEDAVNRIYNIIWKIQDKYAKKMEMIEIDDYFPGRGHYKSFRSPSFKDYKEKNIYSEDDFDFFTSLYHEGYEHKPVEITDLHEFLNPPKQQAIRQLDGKLVEIDEKGKLVEVEEKKPDLKLLN